MGLCQWLPAQPTSRSSPVHIHLGPTDSGELGREGQETQMQKTEKCTLVTQKHFLKIHKMFEWVFFMQN